jgi:hypothetical protein
VKDVFYRVAVAPSHIRLRCLALDQLPCDSSTSRRCSHCRSGDLPGAKLSSSQAPRLRYQREIPSSAIPEENGSWRDCLAIDENVGGAILQLTGLHKREFAALPRRSRRNRRCRFVMQPGVQSPDRPRSPVDGGYSAAPRATVPPRRCPRGVWLCRLLRARPGHLTGSITNCLRTRAICRFLRNRLPPTIQLGSSAPSKSLMWININVRPIVD